MPNPSQNSLCGYVSKIKRETEKLHLYSYNSFTSSKNWVLSKNPKKLLFSPRHKGRNSKTRFPKEDHVRDYHHKVGGTLASSKNARSATLADIDHFLEQNFKSLFLKEDDDEDRVTKNKEKRKLLSSSDDDDDDDYNHIFERTWGQVEYAEPVQKDPFGSFLKFVRSWKYDSSPSPGSSEGSSSMDTTSTSDERHSRSNLLLPENCIALIKYTEEPETDFRRSMIEMLESKLRMSEREVDWDSIKEILSCYLDLNDERSHKYIINAFIDLLITFLCEKEGNSKITKEGLVRLLSTRDGRGMLRR